MIQKIELHNIVVSILCMFKFIMILKNISSTPRITKENSTHRVCIRKVINRLLADLYKTLIILLEQDLLNMCYPRFSSAYKFPQYRYIIHLH